MNEEMIAYLKKLANKDSIYDCEDEDEDIVINDYVGGNIDDAFDSGEQNGEIILAREVLKAMNISWLI
jgi:hypothetical protein